MAVFLRGGSRAGCVSRERCQPQATAPVAAVQAAPTITSTLPPPQRLTSSRAGRWRHPTPAARRAPPSAACARCCWRVVPPLPLSPLLLLLGWRGAAPCPACRANAGVWAWLRSAALCSTVCSLACAPFGCSGGFWSSTWVNWVHVHESDGPAQLAWKADQHSLWARPRGATLPAAAPLHDASVRLSSRSMTLCRLCKALVSCNLAARDGGAAHGGHPAVHRGARAGGASSSAVPQPTPDAAHLQHARAAARSCAASGRCSQAWGGWMAAACCHGTCGGAPGQRGRLKSGWSQQPQLAQHLALGSDHRRGRRRCLLLLQARLQPPQAHLPAAAKRQARARAAAAGAAAAAAQPEPAPPAGAAAAGRAAQLRG